MAFLSKARYNASRPLPPRKLSKNVHGLGVYRSARKSGTVPVKILTYFWPWGQKLARFRGSRRRKADPCKFLSVQKFVRTPINGVLNETIVFLCFQKRKKWLWKSSGDMHDERRGKALLLFALCKILQAINWNVREMYVGPMEPVSKKYLSLYGPKALLSINNLKNGSAASTSQLVY